MAKVDEKQYQALLQALRKLQWTVSCHEQLFTQTEFEISTLKQVEEDLLRFEMEYSAKEKALRQAQQEFASGIRQARLQLVQHAHQIRKILMHVSDGAASLNLPKGVPRNRRFIEEV